MKNNTWRFYMKICYLTILLTIYISMLISGCSPNLPPDLKGRVIFSSDQSGNDDIYIMNSDGQDIKQLTDDPADDFSPVWSSKAQKIAFVSNRTGNPEIYIMNQNGTEQTRLTNMSDSDDEFPAWSPDGSQIAFSLNGQLAILDIKTKNVKQLNFDRTKDISPSWSADGRQIVFASNPHSYTNIYKINPDGSEKTRLTTSDWKTELVDDPSWSPQGNLIAYGRVIFTSKGISGGTFIMSPDGSNERYITDECTGGAWLPDGKWIVCESRARGNNNSSEIYIISVVDGTKYRLTDTPYFERRPDWVP